MPNSVGENQAKRKLAAGELVHGSQPDAHAKHRDDRRRLRL